MKVIAQEPITVTEAGVETKHKKGDEFDLADAAARNAIDAGHVKAAKESAKDAAPATTAAKK
jgi:hypothetical protein